MSPPEISEQQPSYVEFQGLTGAAKHLGGRSATKELVALCHIEEGDHVLDIGCGLGRTASYLAKTYGCRVVGVDLSQDMVDRSRERARKEGVEDRVVFRVADAQNLPFEDETFDAVIGESVTLFVADKPQAASEYVRVTKPGGYVGFNETTWVKTPPPQELVEYTRRAFGANAEIPAAQGWQDLFEAAGLKEIVVRTHEVNTWQRWRDEARELDFKEYVRTWYRFFRLLITSPAYRRFARGIWPVPRSIMQYTGYGIYVGRKQALH